MFVPHGQDEQWPSDTEGHDPDERDLHDRVFLLLGVTVAQRVGQGHVPVDRDHAQMTYSGRCEENIQTIPPDTDQLRHRHVYTVSQTT